MLGKTFKGMTDETLRWQTERFRELAGASDRWIQATVLFEGAFGGAVMIVLTDALARDLSGTGDVTYSVGASTACSIVAGKLRVTSGTGSCAITATRAPIRAQSSLPAADFAFSPEEISAIQAKISAMGNPPINKTRTKVPAQSGSFISGVRLLKS